MQIGGPQVLTGSADADIPTNAIAKGKFAENVAAIEDLPAVVIGRNLTVTGYHPSTTVGGGDFVGGTGRHDGVIYFDPTRASEIGTAAYYVDSGVDAACWVRVGDSPLTEFDAGYQVGQTDELVELVLLALFSSKRCLHQEEIQQLTVTVYLDPIDGSNSAIGDLNNPVKTLQEAVNRVPFYHSVDLQIDLSTAATLPAAYDEDVLMNSAISNGVMGDNIDPAIKTGAIDIIGDSTTPSNVKVGSFTVQNAIGLSAPRLFGVRMMRQSPYSSENGSIVFYGTGECAAWNLEFEPGCQSGVVAYGAKCNVRDIDVTNLEDVGLFAKRNGEIVALNITGDFDPDTVGNFRTAKFWAENNGTISYTDDVSNLVSGFLADGTRGYRITEAEKAGEPVESSYTDHWKNDSLAIGTLTTDQTVSAGSTPKVTFDAEVYDNFVNPFFGFNSVSSFMRPRVTAAYEISGRIAIQTSGLVGSGIVPVQLRDKSNSVIRRANLYLQNTGGIVTLPFSFKINGLRNEEYSIRVQNTFANDFDVVSGNDWTEFEMSRIG